MSRLLDMMDKKCQAETELRHLEKQIFELETNYLEETYQTGKSSI